ncbi:hypothetical protein [Clostridium saccharoperbutylacetonicum]|uniref:hypothetical protein n=1 Tax=Clostridium saccharoperbutylacetonicum TaxID=36745 RepID=UPI0039EA8A25
MISVLADKVLGFHNGDRDNHGNLIITKTKIGFCELPNWVEKTKFYKDAIKDGSLKPFKNSSKSEEVLKEQEKLQALREEIKELEEKKELLKTPEEVIAKAAKSKDKE